MKEVKIDTLVPDDKNFNQGAQYGQHLIEESLRRFGAGRSILLDKNNRIIAGNKTIENAAAIGMDNVIVVETTGDKVVAVKRTDIDLDTKEGREMALADNATSAVNLRWDEDALKQAETEFGIAPSEWGVELGSLNLDDFFDEGTDEQEHIEKKQIIIELPEDYSEEDEERVRMIIKSSLENFADIKIK